MAVYMPKNCDIRMNAVNMKVPNTKITATGACLIRMLSQQIRAITSQQQDQRLACLSEFRANFRDKYSDTPQIGMELKINTQVEKSTVLYKAFPWILLLGSNEIIDVPSVIL